jgi:hypothetical protein
MELQEMGNIKYWWTNLNCRIQMRRKYENEYSSKSCVRLEAGLSRLTVEGNCFQKVSDLGVSRYETT